MEFLTTNCLDLVDLVLVVVLVWCAAADYFSKEVK